MKPNASWQSGLGLLALRLFAAYEFFESGLEKWKGENWFADIHDQFPFPISLLPDSLNWQMAMFAELALPVLLVVGLAARLSALGLMIVTWVAWVSAHAGAGYNVCDNGYKMALIYLVVLFPILLQGAGGFSLDALLKKYVLKK
ncbi:DoxX family protein [Neisseria sp. ZJ106]|uniref:DoxX family protein n=1 Tax=Neisseria lisongii TaxID=2912188 RepID=A0ABY7RJB3_9NEIS|nr:DoxX family protein [Neisseria lisongii]MCF7520910.1 DoxX family protein [Neisseria lisongii]WCL71283.1 DoxX family protein [Neisseria lisongii]